MTRVSLSLLLILVLLYHHCSQELKWQAAKILGSVDFLGNPLGFVADVSEGVTGLLLEGNVGALLKNVTHGISNSAAKVTGIYLMHSCYVSLNLFIVASNYSN